MTRTILSRLECFIAENPKTARAFLKAVGYPRPLQSVGIETLDEHTPESRVAELLSPLEQGIDCGLLSDAGCPAVADPGALLVRKAHAAGIKVVPLVGPSALLLALMASGMNGQRFAFWGYLPVERGARAKRLSELENRSDEEDVTQIFIETPYRNDALLDAILTPAASDTLLCLATDPHASRPNRSATQRVSGGNAPARRSIAGPRCSCYPGRGRPPKRERRGLISEPRPGSPSPCAPTFRPSRRRNGAPRAPRYSPAA